MKKKRLFTSSISHDLDQADIVSEYNGGPSELRRVYQGAFGNIRGTRGIEILQHNNVPHYRDKHWPKIDICCNTLLLISSILFFIPAGHPPKKTGILFLGMDRFQRNTMQTLISSLYDLNLATRLNVTSKRQLP